MATKEYFGRQPGKIAGVPNWRGGPLITANTRHQDKIESHPWFAMGLIELVSEDLSAKPDKQNWGEYIASLKYNELQALAKDRDIRYVGVSAKDLIETLTEMGE